MPTFASPYIFIAAIIVPILGWLYYRRIRQQRLKITFPALHIVHQLRPSRPKTWLRHLPSATKWTALLFLIVALARPQSISKGQDIYSEGIDIVIALDISASMMAQDFHPDRARAAKAVAEDFIKQRPNDRIGIVLFAKQAFTQCPLTIDHDILLDLLHDVQVGLADADNTAIGSGLATCLNRLKGSTSKSKVVILLTDGENNYGLPPTTAAEAAQALGVRVYTVGVGTRGVAPVPAQDVFGRTVMQQMQVSIDEDLLSKIAESTGGRYFRATDENKLREIFAEIDRMEKSKIEVRAYRRYEELFYPWVLAALGLLVIGLGAGSWLVRGVV